MYIYIDVSIYSIFYIHLRSITMNIQYQYV